MINQKNAVTIIELLIVIIIIGILVSIAVPVYTNRIERTRGERAIANIELMVSAAKQYAIRYDAPPLLPLESLTEINKSLNLELADTNFTYKVEPIGNPLDQDQYGQIKAERHGESIIYNIDPMDGNPDEWDTANSTWLKKWMP